MRARGGPGRVLWVAGVLLLALLPSGSRAADGEPPAPRVVAVGDVHGSFDGLVSILATTGLVDDQRRWAGGDTVLVQIGDLLDRGVDVRPVLDLMMSLEEQAEAAGGKVVCLLGNHEGMNLLGIRRDVHPGAYAAFAGPQSEKRQKAAWDAVVRHYRARARHFSQAPPRIDRSVKARWMEQNPPGAVEYVEALGPDGTYGRWLRSLPVAVLLGETLFIHAGLGPDLEGLDLETVDRQVADEIARHDRLKAFMLAEGLAFPEASIFDLARVAEKEWEAFSDPAHPDRSAHEQNAETLRPLLGWQRWFLASSGGPIWFRGAVHWDEGEHGAEMASLLDGVGATRMVVGHTVPKDRRVQTRFGGRVVLLDTGMQSGYYAGGCASALEIVDGALTAVYLDRREAVGASTSPDEPLVEPGPGLESGGGAGDQVQDEVEDQESPSVTRLVSPSVAGSAPRSEGGRP